MTTIVPIKKSFVFQFREAVNTRGEFMPSTTSGGIVLQSSFDDSAKQARWVNIVAAGPECDRGVFSPGNTVLLPALRWTESAKLDGQPIWKSNTDEVVAYVDDNGSLQSWGRNVLFTATTQQQKQTSFGLIIARETSDTASGIITHTTHSDLLPGYTIYFNGDNFFDTFTHNGVEYSFIKADDILGYITEQ